MNFSRRRFPRWPALNFGIFPLARSQARLLFSVLNEPLARTAATLENKARSPLALRMIHVYTYIFAFEISRLNSSIRRASIRSYLFSLRWPRSV